MAYGSYCTGVSYPSIGMVIEGRSSRKLLSVQEAASRLHVSRRTAYRMVADGIIGWVPRGAGRGRIAIPVEVVDDYLTSLKANARRMTA